MSASPAARTAGAPFVFVAPSAYPLGGVATWLDYAIPGLRRRGRDARVVLVDGRHHDAAAYRCAHPAIEPVTVSPRARATDEGRIRALAACLRGMRPACVVGVNLPHALLAAARLKGAHERVNDGPAVVMSVHGLEPDLFGDLARLAPGLDGAVCSNRLAVTAAESLIESERVHYAPYGVGCARAPERTPASRLRLGYAGRFERFQKRVQDLPAIEAALARRGLECDWVIAGDGPDRESIDALARAARGRFTDLGQLPADDMAERFYASVDVLVSPSAWETGPIVVFEAMAHGVAIVSSRYVGSVREGSLVDGDNALLHAIGDVDGAADAIARAHDSELRAQLVAGGRALVETRYSRRASVDAWTAALDAIVAAPRRSATVPSPRAAGRLDRLLGTGLADTVRALSGRTIAGVRDAGDEWPHCLQSTRRDEPSHWQRLRALDAGSSEGRVT